VRIRDRPALNGSSITGTPRAGSGPKHPSRRRADPATRHLAGFRPHDLWSGYDGRFPKESALAASE
jgi:hypothetical protein